MTCEPPPVPAGGGFLAECQIKGPVFRRTDFQSVPAPCGRIGNPSYEKQVPGTCTNGSIRRKFMFQGKVWLGLGLLACLSAPVDGWAAPAPKNKLPIRVLLLAGSPTRDYQFLQ